MRATRLVVSAVVTTCLVAVVIAATAGLAWGSEANVECLNCHGVGGVTAGEVDFAAQVDMTKCNSCHWYAVHDFDDYHVAQNAAPDYLSQQCGACHHSTGQFPQRPVIMGWPTAFTASGWFQSAASVEQSAGAVHAIHVNGTWLKDQSGCNSCHGAAACSACHADPAPTHADHGSLGQREAPVTYSIGKKFGDTSPDTYLYASAPSTNYDVATAFYVGRTSSGEERAVLRFPLAEVSGTTVTGATLNLTRSSGSAFPLRVYRLRRTDWVSSQATWTNYRAGAPWGTAGANSSALDYYADVYAESSSGVFDVTALVQAARAAGESNLELLILDPAPVARRYNGFYASNGLNSAWYPWIKIDGTRALNLYAYGPVAGTEPGNENLPEYVTADKTCLAAACHDLTQAGSDRFAPTCASCHPDRTVAHGYDAAMHMAAPAAELIAISGENYGPFACEDCHNVELGVEHTKPSSDGGARGCAECHPTPRSSFSDWDKSCEQGGCHTPTSEAPMHGSIDASHSVPAGTSCMADGCHGGGNLASLHRTASNVHGVVLSCKVCHAPGATPSSDCSDCHEREGSDYHRNMAVHRAPDSYETCGHCHHGWGSSPIQGPDVTRHSGGCATCHNATGDLTGLTTKCVNCHDEEGVNYHVESELFHSPKDAGSLECAECHDTTDVRDLHTTNGCETCHVTKTCTECHSMHNGNPGTPLLSPLSCQAVCHKVEGTDYHRSFEASHTNTGMQSSCQTAGCHTAQIITEHDRFVGAGNRYPQYEDSCALCHKNVDPGRVPPGATADCLTCHEDPGEHGYDGAMHTATAIGSGDVLLFNNHDGMGVQYIYADCASCHTKDLSDTHAGQCSTCHPTPRSTFTTWNDSCQQGGCHATIHAKAGTAHDSADCEGCHDQNWNVSAAYCDGCHAFYSAADLTPPTTTSDARASYSGSARIRFSVSDGGRVGVATTLYRLDGGQPQRGESLEVTQTGSHSLEFWSVDQNGNAESPRKSASFTVTADTTPPVTTSDAKAAYEGPAVIQLNATDASFLGVKATYYRLNSGAVQNGKTISISQPSAGSVSYTLQYWSEDYSGNVETTKTASFVVTRDITPPVSTVNPQPYYRTTSVSIAFSAVDTGSGVGSRYYRVDGGALNALGTSATSFTRTYTQGPHSVEYWSVDKVANTEAHRTASFIVDATSPTVSSNAATSYPESGASITITASDLPANGSGLDGIRYQVDGGVVQSVAGGSALVSISATGSHSLVYWALDRAGNTSSQATKVFSVGQPSAGGTGILKLVWGDADTSGNGPQYDSWASWSVRSGSFSGPVVAQGYQTADSGTWNGVDEVSVPVQTVPYFVQIDWYDADWENSDTTYHSNVLISFPGQVVRLSY